MNKVVLHILFFFFADVHASFNHSNLEFTQKLLIMMITYKHIM